MISDSAAKGKGGGLSDKPEMNEVSFNNDKHLTLSKPQSSNPSPMFRTTNNGLKLEDLGVNTMVVSPNNQRDSHQFKLKTDQLE